MKRIFFTLLFIQLSSYFVFSQVNNRLLENNITYTDSKFQFNVYNHNYMRNYEYFNKFADGLTYFGSILHPEFIYNADKKLSLQAGLFIRQDYGRGGIYEEQPTFTINYHPGKWQIIAGKLNGNVMHRMPEPMYNYDRIIYNNLEFGNQFIYTDSNLKFDAWINWEKMIYKISPTQEEVSGGFHIDYKLLKNKKHKIEIPVSVFAYHKGGQIDTPDRTLITLFNSSIGIDYKYLYKEKKDHYIWLESHVMGYLDYSNTKVYPEDNGYGLLATLGWKFGHTSLSTTYWQGNNFIGIHGAPLYQSTSTQINNENFFSTERKLLFIRLISDYEINDQFSISSRLEPYFDLNNPQFEFSNSLFLTYRNQFDLAKNKSK